MCHRERAPAEFEADTDVLSSYKKNLKRILVDISEYMLLLGLNELLHEYFRLWGLLESMHLNLSTEEEDQIIWTLESSGQYSDQLSL